MQDAPRKDLQQGVLGDIRRENSAGMLIWAAWGLLHPFLDLAWTVEYSAIAGLAVLTLVRLYHWARLELWSPEEESIEAAWDAQAGLAARESFGDAESTLSAAEQAAVWATPLGYCAVWMLDLDVLLAHAYAAAILCGIAVGVVYRAVAKRWVAFRNDPG